MGDCNNNNIQIKRQAKDIILTIWHATDNKLSRIRHEVTHTTLEIGFALQSKTNDSLNHEWFLPR